MAEANLRKSGRPRKSTSYWEEDFKFDYDMDVDEEGDSSVENQTKRKRFKEKSPKQKKHPEMEKNVELSAPPEDDESNHTVEYNSNVGQDTTESEVSNFSHSLDESTPKSKKKLSVMPRSGGFTCEVCEKVCVDMASFKRHMKGHSSDRKFHCEICSKAFIDGCSLKRHMKIHGDERPFTCDLCFKSFRDAPSLTRHHQTHMDRPRTFSCQTCGKSFTDKHGLTRHERTHTGLRPFECGVCGKTFSESGSFKRHQKIHTGIRRFSCVACGKKFLEKQSLLRHQRVVCGVMEDTTKNNAAISPTLDKSEISFDSVDTSNVSSFSQDSEPNTLPVPEKVKSSAVASRSTSSGLKHAKKGAGSAPDTVAEVPSLQSLMKKDPNLYAGISDLVESIDSYEQMLDLCGDSGHSQIDAALTRDPEPMPDNLLCFECGEHLVDGENFRKEGKTFRLPLKNQFRCLNCEEDDNVDHGEPPDLTPEAGDVLSSADIPNGDADGRQTDSQDHTHCLPNGEGSMNNAAADDADEERQSNTPVNAPHDNQELNHSGSLENLEDGKRQGKSSSSVSGHANLVTGTEESLDHFRERLRAQHGVYFLGEMYPHVLSTMSGALDDTDSTTATSTNASVSRSSSTEDTDPYFQDLETKVTFQEAETSIAPAEKNFAVSRRKGNPKSRSLSNKAIELIHEENAGSDIVTPDSTESVSKPVYAADDPSIPTVFPCHLCTKVFATAAFLARHLYLHRNSPHKCVVCSKTFTNAVSLRRHMTTHTGEKPYSCPLCSKRFRDPSNFSKHKKICPGPQATSSPAPSPAASGSLLVPSSNVTMEPKKGRKRSRKSEIVKQIKPSTDVALIDPAISPEPAEILGDEDTGLSGHHDLPPTPVMKFSYDVDDEDADLSVSFGEPGQQFSPQNDADLLVSFGEPRQQFSPQNDADLPVSFGEPHQFTSRNGYEFYGEVEEHEHFVAPKISNAGELSTLADITPNNIKELEQALHCGVCERSFLKEKDLQNHMRFHSAHNPELTCEECGKSFHDSSGLKRHVRIHADTRPHVCEFCHRGYCDNWSLRKHQSRGCLLSELQVPASFMVPCPQCNRVFATAEMQAEHIAAVHKGALKFECDICLKRFSEAFNLKRHRRLHMAVCPGCEREFKDVKDLAEHQRSECLAAASLTSGSGPLMKDGTFPCPECGRVYTTKANLERHKKFHSSLKPHVCEICQKRFSEAFKLKRHMKVHSESKPHACPNCKKGFSNAQGLKQHLQKTRCLSNTYPSMNLNTAAPQPQPRMITPPPPPTPVSVPSSKPTTPSSPSSGFPCDVCGKVFRKKFLLVRHMNVHSVERPYICGQCGRAYKDTSSLKRHCLVHRGVKDFVCPDCGKAFFYSDTLKRHRNGLCGRTAPTSEGGQLVLAKNWPPRRRGRKRKLKYNSDVFNNNNDVNNGSKPSEQDPVGITAFSPLAQDTPQEPMEASHTPETGHTASPQQSGLDQQNVPSFEALVSPRHSFRLPSKSFRVGRWSCLKGHYCWRCGVMFPSNKVLMEHAVIHKHKKPFVSRGGLYRCSRKCYLGPGLSHDLRPVRAYVATQPQEETSGLKIKLKLLPKSSSDLSSSHDQTTDPQLDDITDLDDSNPRPKRSIARARWSWISQIQ